MPRGRKTSPLWSRVEDWRAARDRNGQWLVVNVRGESILRHPDPLVRMRAVYLAAAAPELRELLWRVSTRLQNHLLDHGQAYTRDAVLVREALIVVGSTVPPLEEARRLMSQGQLELQLDGEEDVLPVRRRERRPASTHGNRRAQSS